MRIWATDRGTEIQLDSQERKTLRKAASVLATLAKHHGGEQEVAAAKAVEPVAKTWGKEPVKNAK